MKKLIAVLLCLSMMLTVSCRRGNSGADDEDRYLLELATWNPEAAQAVNDFLEKYGKGSEKYDKTAYAVFDFDETVVMGPVQDQVSVYQVRHLMFAEDMGPDKLAEALSEGLEDVGKSAGTAHSKKNATYGGWIADITTAYGKLQEKYGPFGPAGVEEDVLSKLKKDGTYEVFVAKMLALRQLVRENEPEDVSHRWPLFWFAGMTEDEAYAVARKALHQNRDTETEKAVYASDDKASNAGKASVTVTLGASVPDNVIELLHALSANGIKVWIVSSESPLTAEAALDEWEAADDVAGVLGVGLKEEDGVYAAEYDEGGISIGTPKDGKWEKRDAPVSAVPCAEGKVLVINDVLVKEYGHGPVIGATAAQDGFNFCTEFSSMKLCLVFNRADSDVTDGAGLLAEICCYQADALGYDLEKAEEAGDTLYVLQGRDENGLRSFLDGRYTVKAGSSDEVLYKEPEAGAVDDNQAQYDYMEKNKMTTAEAVNNFAYRMSGSSQENVLGFPYGFFEEDEFQGYHTNE